MKCTKTGCHVYLEERGEFVYGDAFQYGGMLYLNLVARSQEPINSSTVIHYTVHREVHWFNERATSMSSLSVLVSDAWSDHGYEGRPI